MVAESIRQAAERRKTTRGDAIAYGVVQDVIPSVLQEIRARKGSGAGTFWDTGAADFIDAVADNPAALEQLAARVKADGATNMAEVKRAVLQEIERNEPGALADLIANNVDFAAMFEVPESKKDDDKKDDDDKQNGTTTVTLPNGQTVTIKQKSS